MEFHPSIAHGIAPECGASDIRHKSTPNEAQGQNQLFVSELEERSRFCMTCKAVSLRPTHTDCHINTACES